MEAQGPLTFHLASINGTDNQIFHTDTGGGFGEWLPDSAHFFYYADRNATTDLSHIDGRPPLALEQQAIVSPVWLAAQHFLFVSYTAGLWLGKIDEDGAAETQRIGAGATTFDLTRLPPAVSMLPTR